MTVAMTWPQAAHLATHIPPFDDSLLSIWRISWIAHAVATPATLVDTNIFYPELRTLAYTDAVLLQGLLGAPFIIAGASSVTVYNVIVLVSIALSGAAMCLLVQRLTGRLSAGLVAGVIYAFVPYRFDHYMHLELHATVFLPLALWFFDRAVERGRWLDVAGFGACMVLQTLSGIYYTVFLATALAFAVPIRLWQMPDDLRRPLVRRLLVVTLAAGVVTAPYLAIYMQNRNTVGEREPDEVARYSAVPLDYLATETSSLLYGAWTGELGRPERRLFPGTLAIVLAIVGIAGWRHEKTMLAVLAFVGFVLSLGVNTPIYTVLRDVVFTYRGLRAPARASILVFLAIAAFAGYGWARILQKKPGWRLVGTAVVIALLYLEYVHMPAQWLILPKSPPLVARWLAQQPPSVVVEFPLPTADSLSWIHDGLYMQASTFHWQPMLNGYSGFYPKSYIELIEEMRQFPSDAAIDYLKSRNVDLIVLHGAYLQPGVLGEWATALSARRDLTPVAEFQESGGPDIVFRISRQP
jgi:hypothetical protein